MGCQILRLDTGSKITSLHSTASCICCKTPRLVDFSKVSGRLSFPSNSTDSVTRVGLTVAVTCSAFTVYRHYSLFSYYLKYVMDGVDLADLQTQLCINGGMKTLALCDNLFFAFFIDKLGRRPSA